MIFFSKSLIVVCAVSVFVTGCGENYLQQRARTNSPSLSTGGGNQTMLALTSVSLTEDFEVGSTSPKTSYDVSPTGSSSGDNVTLHSKSWNMYDALIGNLSGDLGSGSWSARIRNSGKITMLFDVTNGISTVTIK